MGRFSVRMGRDIKLGVKNLLLHKLRSFLTMLGLVFGVGSVIAMLAIGEGASLEALSQIRKLGSRNIMLAAAKPVEEENSQKRARLVCYGLLYDDVKRLEETIPTIDAAVPVKTLEKTGRLGTRSLDLRLVATTERWF